MTADDRYALALQRTGRDRYVRYYADPRVVDIAMQTWGPESHDGAAAVLTLRLLDLAATLRAQYQRLSRERQISDEHVAIVLPEFDLHPLPDLATFRFMGWRCELGAPDDVHHLEYRPPA